MADLQSTRVFGGLTVIHDAILKKALRVEGDAQILGELNVTEMTANRLTIEGGLEDLDQTLLNELLEVRDGVQSTNVIQAQNNGVVAGIGISTEDPNNTQIYFAADKIAIINGSDLNSAVVPFIVENGQVLIDTAYIQNLSADNIQSLDFNSTKIQAGDGTNVVRLGNSSVPLWYGPSSVAKGNETYSNSAFAVNSSGSIKVDNGSITGSTITGGTLQTSSSGFRTTITGGNTPIWVGSSLADAIFKVSNDGKVVVNSLTSEGSVITDDVDTTSLKVSDFATIDDLTVSTFFNYSGKAENFSLPPVITRDHFTRSLKESMLFIDPDASQTGGTAELSQSNIGITTYTTTESFESNNKNITVTLDFTYSHEYTVLENSYNTPYADTPYVEFTAKRGTSTLTVPSNIISLYSWLSDQTGGVTRVTGTVTKTKLNEYQPGGGGEPGFPASWRITQTLNRTFSYTAPQTFTGTSNFAIQINNRLSGESGGIDLDYTVFEPVGSDGVIALTNWDAVEGKPFETIGSGLSVSGTTLQLGMVSYTNLPFSSTDVTNWGTGAYRADYAWDRAVTGFTGAGNGNLVIHRYQLSNLSVDLSHTHDSSDITSGTLSSSRLPTITTSMVNFANQSLNTNSSPEFTKAILNEGFFSSISGAVSSRIWAISPSYPDYGIFYEESNPDYIRFKWSGANKASIDLQNGVFYGNGSGLTGTASLRATGTTKADVGLGSVDNYSRAHYDGRYLGISAKAADSDKLDGITSGSFLRSDSTDYINGVLYMRADIRTEGSFRDHGIYGHYESYKTAHIWSMGSNYRIPSNGSDFGNLYGFAYKHTNNTTGGTMAGSHQVVWCHNGIPKVALGKNVWTSGKFIGDGGGLTGTASLRATGTTKSDVGLGNVPNTDATNASNISSGTLNSNRIPSDIARASGDYLTSTKLGNYIYLRDYDDGNSSTGLKTYIRDGTWHINPDSSTTGSAQINLGGNQVYHEGHKPTYSELGTITTGDVNFANQSLNTNSNVNFNNATINGQIISSAATLQVNGFMRTGNIYLHEGDDSAPTSPARALSNAGGALEWDGNQVYHEGHKPTYSELGTITDNYISKNFDTIRPAIRYGITGGYGYNSGSGGSWGSNIWSIGDNWAGIGAGTGFSLDSGQYGLVWLRDGHVSARSDCDEGLYIYRAGTVTAALGHTGAYFRYNIRADDFISTSDKKLKSNFEEIECALAKVDKLNGLTFNRKDQEKRQAGFIAQDLQEVLPEGVFENDDGYLSVSNSAVIGLLIEAVKEEKSKRESLESRIAKLERLIL